MDSKSIGVLFIEAFIYSHKSESFPSGIFSWLLLRREMFFRNSAPFQQIFLLCSCHAKRAYFASVHLMIVKNLYEMYTNLLVISNLLSKHHVKSLLLDFHLCLCSLLKVFDAIVRQLHFLRVELQVLSSSSRFCSIFFVRRFIIIFLQDFFSVSVKQLYTSSACVDKAPKTPPIFFK